LKQAGGFTMVELVTVMVLAGVLAAIGVPALMGDNSMAAATFGDEVASALRAARNTALAHRRLVCAGVGGNAVILHLAAEPGAAACSIALPGEGAATAASGVAASAHILYFQPSGRITSDAAGRNPARGSVTISLHGLERRSIVFEGSTGYVQ
jgi:MSHA pilin protein MshC